MSHTWSLLIFSDTEKTHLLTSSTHKTIREVAYILGMKQDEVSNCFHKLIRPRKMLMYCELQKVKRVQKDLRIKWYISTTSQTTIIKKYENKRSINEKANLGFRDKPGRQCATRGALPVPANGGGQLRAAIRPAFRDPKGEDKKFHKI